MKVTGEQIEAGQAVYTKRTLALYDFVVLGVSNRFIWKCPTPRIEAHYNRHITANHLDVGVGTGYFLDRCHFPSDTPRVALMDLNPETLEFASRRIARYHPESFRRNVLEPISLGPEKSDSGKPGSGKPDSGKFDSIGINYLLHCIPGSIESKSVAFDHLKALMNPGARIFGSTLLQGGVHRSGAARRLMGIYNKKGIFSNAHDDLDGLRRELERRFEEVSIEIAGCAALFSARR